MRLSRLLTVVAAGAVAGACGAPTTAPSATPGPPASSTASPDGDREATVAHGRARCGVERWAVKTGSDPDEHLIDLTKPPTLTTVAALTALKPPNPIPPNNRVAPTETTVYQLHATLTGFKQENDSDVHLILSDGDRTMIAEIPSPACTTPDPLKAGISNARHQFDQLYHAGPQFQHVQVPVTITGIGLFDFPHGQAGAAPDGVEIHPVLNITFN